MEYVSGNQRLEDVEFEVATHASNCNSNIVAHNLSAKHGQSLALSWIDLSWHDTRSWLIFWKIELTESASRSTSQKSDIVGDLH